MGIVADYKSIFQREVESVARDLICLYAPITDIYVFQPLSHHCLRCGGNCADDCHVHLGALMRKKDDNQEIKGYDLTYFSVYNGNVSLWLGQAKMGHRDYCKRDIKDDLLTKFGNEYLSQQLYFIADKQAGITDEGKLITDVINKINMRMCRARKLFANWCALYQITKR